jgi:ATP-dependent Clp protease ATP-binding subunit ClpC
MALHLSESSEAVKRRGMDLSRRWKHHYLSCEHLFLACCIEDSSCEEWLSGRGFSIDDFEEHILDLVPTGDDKPIWDGIPESPRLRRVLAKMAQAEAEESRAMRVEPIHILRAVIKEGRGIPCRILRDISPSGSSGAPVSGGSRTTTSSHRPGGGDQESASGTSRGDGDKKKGKSPFLDKYSRDIVQMVADGKVDPIIGRTDEIRRVIQILARKTKSNPVLIGEAGVGKTAVAFGLARRIYEDKVPDALKNKRVLELSLSSMVAGAKHRGEFEERLEGVVKETMAAHDIILFIDEIHQLVGAGDSRGGMDASNILKPALARGELTVLGATTTDEFRKYIEKDPALERRFQPVLVGEPSEEEALEMLTGLRKRFEIHHGVKFTDAALATAISLSVRYVPDRNLPDKAIDLIDEAAARVKTRSGVFQLDEHGRASMAVDENMVAEVVADWTGIPVQRMSEQETTRLLRMEQELEGRVVGQDHALTAVAQAIRVVRVGLVAPNRPGGVFMFMGPSGVGKTELAKAMADFLFGDPNEMVRLDMSEYHDKHSVSRLIGSPPGYVGHDEEGQLTRAVRTKPYCVVLLDEVEKAHPEIFDLFLQVFDDGRLTDSKGRTVNFTNTIIIMTSNLGSRELLEAKLPNQGYAGQLDTLPQQYQNALRGHFRPEFLNRVDEIIAFRALERSDLYGIADIHLGSLKKNLEKSRKVKLELTSEAVELLLEFGYQPQFGARPLQRAISTHLSRPLAEEMLRHPPAEGAVLLAERDGNKLVFRPAAGGHRPEPQRLVAPPPSQRVPDRVDEIEPPLLPGAQSGAQDQLPPPMRRIDLEPDPFDEEESRPRDVDHFPPPGSARTNRLRERLQESQPDPPVRPPANLDPFQTGISGGGPPARASSPDIVRRPSLGGAPGGRPPIPPASGGSTEGPSRGQGQGQPFSPLRSPKPGDPRP